MTDGGLEGLARLFPDGARLYAVGGFVRDSALGLDVKDIDICSALPVQEVIDLLDGSGYTVCVKNMRLGTVRIKSSCGESYEYTAFRTDSYDRSSGAHSPEYVIFTDDINADALRRDFACNAVYRDILDGSVVDPLGGQADIEARVLRAADAPDRVFSADGLRVLRLVRFACELGFDIESETLECARRNAYRVADITPDRIREELDKIFVADSRHPELALTDAHMRGVRMLDALGLIEILLPELAALKGLKQPEKYHKYDAYEHSIQAFGNISPHLRWAALLHDVGKAESVRLNGNMHGHARFSAELADGVFKRYRFDGKRRDRYVRLIENHMYDVNGNMSAAKMRRFVVEHADIVEDLAELIDADAMAASGCVGKNRLRETYLGMKRDNIPMSVAELPVDGNDLITLGAPKEARGALMKKLLSDAAMDPLLADRSRAVEYLKKQIKKIK